MAATWQRVLHAGSHKQLFSEGPNLPTIMASGNITSSSKFQWSVRQKATGALLSGSIYLLRFHRTSGSTPSAVGNLVPRVASQGINASISINALMGPRAYAEAWAWLWGSIAGNVRWLGENQVATSFYADYPIGFVALGKDCRLPWRLPGIILTLRCVAWGRSPGQGLFAVLARFEFLQVAQARGMVVCPSDGKGRVQVDPWPWLCLLLSCPCHPNCSV